jgi:hypothetical protein
LLTLDVPETLVEAKRGLCRLQNALAEAENPRLRFQPPHERC